jgi:hypothetical protein
MGITLGSPSGRRDGQYWKKCTALTMLAKREAAGAGPELRTVAAMQLAYSTQTVPINT